MARRSPGGPQAEPAADAGQKIALGRIHKHQTVTVLVSETTLAVELDDGDVQVIRRTTNPAGA